MGSSDKFKSGDIVMLKSGGPNMTIDSRDEYSNYYHCHWFAGGKLQSGSFAEDTLILAADADTTKNK